MSNAGTRRSLRSQNWFDNPAEPDMTVLFLERYMNYGLTREELQSGKPIIGIAQTGNDLSPCNRHHLELAKRVREGVREAGGIAFEFPVHPIQETSRRPTAALDRNLAYLGLVEVLHGYPLDGVVLTTGCDKTTPAALMAAATVDIPAIVLSGGPMLNGWFRGRRVGTGTVLYQAREQFSAGQISEDEYWDIVSSAVAVDRPLQHDGHGLDDERDRRGARHEPARLRGHPGGLSRPQRDGLRDRTRGRADGARGRRPSSILVREAFENAIRVTSAIGGSTNAPPHVIAIARHAGVELTIEDWQTYGHDVPLLVNMQPAGEYLGEEFHRAGGVPGVVNELMKAEPHPRGRHDGQRSQHRRELRRAHGPRP